jgi:7-cyano-7-deazaguanine synthase
MSRSALLLSGGMDSTALAWSIRPEIAITIDYGQRAARGEFRAAAAVCATLNIRHRSLAIDCRALGSGDLAGTTPHPTAPVSEWWPFRNQLLITLASGIVLHEGLTTIVLGSVSSDKTHADGRTEFFEAMGRLLRLQEGGIDVEVPGINESSVSLCRKAGVPFELLAWSHSCHVSDYACGTWRGGLKHRETMRELGYGEY